MLKHFLGIKHDRARFYAAVIFGLPVLLVLSPVLILCLYCDLVQANHDEMTESKKRGTREA